MRDRLAAATVQMLVANLFMQTVMTKNIPVTKDEVIELAWADEVSFDAIKRQTGLAEADVIKLMRRSLKPSSFRLWRARVSGRKSKHDKAVKTGITPSAVQ